MSNLNNLNAWNNDGMYFSSASAQGYLNNAASMNMSSTSCGASDDEPKEEKPSSCGSSCGAGDDK